MSRIRKFYENRFARLAKIAGEPIPEFVSAQIQRASERSRNHRLHLNFALALIYADLRSASGETQSFPKKFACDAGLGGLARLLRGAGYESQWNPALDDAALIRHAGEIDATLITTDTMMMERGVLRDNLAPAVCVPSSLTRAEQFTVVFRELQFSLLEPRCMACGGELSRVPKSAVIDRIPPRTALWLDDYFICNQCNHLFWQGTHWQRITHNLEELAKTNGSS